MKAPGQGHFNDPVPQTHESGKAFPGQALASVDNFLLLGDYSLRLLSFRDLLSRLASPPPCSAVYNKPASLIWMYKVNALRSQVVASVSNRVPDPSSSVCVSVLSSLSPQSGFQDSAIQDMAGRAIKYRWEETRTELYNMAAVTKSGADSGSTVVQGEHDGLRIF